MAKSDKMYASSPSVKKDANGKPGISKPTKATATDIGLAGEPAYENQPAEMPIHVKQYKDMYERHMLEMKDMHKRHQKEHDKLSADHFGTDDASESVAKEGTE